MWSLFEYRAIPHNRGTNDGTPPCTSKHRLTHSLTHSHSHSLTHPVSRLLTHGNGLALSRWPWMVEGSEASLSFSLSLFLSLLSSGIVVVQKDWPWKGPFRFKRESGRRDTYYYTFRIGLLFRAKREPKSHCPPSFRSKLISWQEVSFQFQFNFQSSNIVPCSNIGSCFTWFTDLLCRVD